MPVIDQQKSYDSLQDLFNDIYTRMLKQGKPSRGESSCLYRSYLSGEKLACAIGLVLSDETVERLHLLKANPSLPQAGEMSKGSLESEMAKEIHQVLLPNLDPELRANFLHDMQQAHDLVADPRLRCEKSFLDFFKERARHVALKYSLTIPSVDG